MSDKKKRSFWRSIGRRDTSSRHSMIEASSQCSLNDSSEDLRSTRLKSQDDLKTGSLDRLTAKPPKSGLFKLKPKTPAFWKPLFQHSNSAPSSLTASVVSKPLRHQLVQTDSPTKIATNDFGVQAVIVGRSTHTRDVLVQTCPAWVERPGPANAEADPKPSVESGSDDRRSSAVVRAPTDSFGDKGTTTGPSETTFAAEDVNANRRGSATSEYQMEQLGETPSKFATCDLIFSTLKSETESISEEVKMMEYVPPESEFDDPEWKMLCETFPEIQTSLLNGTQTKPKMNCQPEKKEFNTIDGNPLSALTLEFEQLRTDSPTNISVSKNVADFIINPNFDVLREEKQSYIPEQYDSSKESATAESLRHGYSSLGETEEKTSDLTFTIDQNVPKVVNSPDFMERNDSKTSTNNSFADVEKIDVSSSCSSRNSMLSGVDTLLRQSAVTFDSCENLDQLEDEIIRSLYSPMPEFESSQIDFPIQKTVYVSSELNVKKLDVKSLPEVDAKVNLSDDSLSENEEDAGTLTHGDSDRRYLIYDPNASKHWMSLPVPLENITEESATDDDTNSQTDYKNGNANHQHIEDQTRDCFNSSLEPPSRDVVNSPLSVSPGLAAVNEVSEVLVELPPRKAKICLDVRELARISRARANSANADELNNDISYATIAECNGHQRYLDIAIKDEASKEPLSKLTTEETVTNPISPDNKEGGDSLPEARHISQSFITLKKVESPTLQEFGSPDETKSIPPPPPPPPPPRPEPNSRVNSHSPNCAKSSSPDILLPETVDKSQTTSNVSGKSPMVFELEQKFLTRQKLADDLENMTKKIAMDAHKESQGLSSRDIIENNINGRSFQNQNGYQNGHEELKSPSPTTLSYNKTPVSRQYITNGDHPVSFPSRTVITDQPPPPGAVLIDEKVTIEGEKVHRDKYYALPVKEVLKEKTSTTKFIPAPSKYEGIGPTEEGVPLSLRQSVKKENMSDWYKTMYRTLHKLDNEDDHYVIGYTSDPEVKREEKRSPKKLDIAMDERTHENTLNGNVIVHAYPASAKSTLNTYSSHPRPIADYEPGYSSSVDNQPDYVSKRYFPTVNQTKPSYEIKDGFESENYVLKRNLCLEPDAEKQKVWYRQVQQGGDIPQFGLGKPAPERPIDPIIGPPPPPPAQISTIYQYPTASRPPTLPPDNTSNMNGNYNVYAEQMRQALHSEMQQKGYQISSPNGRSPKRLSIEKKILARALYNFTAESAREVSLKKDDVVMIYRELDKNWYEGEHNAAVGIFPISYVEILPPEHTTPSPQPPKLREGSGKVLFDFMAHTSVELQAKKGDEIQLIRKVDDNWFEGRIGIKKGIIPTSYVSVIEEPGVAPSPRRQVVSPPKCASSPSRLLEISASSPVSTVSSTTLSSPSVVSVQPEITQNGFKSRGKKGNRLIEPVPYRALYRYSPQNADELELIDGDTIYVVEVCDDGWYVGTSVRTGELGIIPGNYMEKVF